jgi:hypothetical protein
MSDPRYRDPRNDPPLRDDEFRSSPRVDDMTSSNAMWGWIAGGVLVLLIVVFVFAGGRNTDTASNDAVPQRPAETTGAAPPRTPAPPATTQAPQRTPSTTGQGTGTGQ